MTSLPFTLFSFKILMVARWSVIFFTFFFWTPHFAHDSGTTSTTRLVYFGNACSGRLGVASFFR
jgi:hypothetical protein